MAVTPGDGCGLRSRAHRRHDEENNLSICIAGTPQHSTATPGSTEWIKAHLARMDDGAGSASPSEDVATESVVDARR